MINIFLIKLVYYLFLLKIDLIKVKIPNKNPIIIEKLIKKIPNRYIIIFFLLKFFKANLKKSNSITRLIKNKIVRNCAKYSTLWKNIIKARISKVIKDDKACDKVAKLPLVSNFFLDKKTGK